MTPRSWFDFSLLLIAFFAACQPIRPTADVTSIPAAEPAVPSTSTTGATDCPILANQPIDLLVESKWQAGDARRYRASFSRTPVQDGEERSTITTSYAMSVTVLDADEDGFIMEWQSIAMLPTPRKIRLEYSTTPFGEFTELRNVDELQALVEPHVVLQDILGSAPSDQRIETIINDPDAVTALIANDVQAYHAIYGLYFTEATPYLQEQASTLPATDTPGTITIRITPTRYDAAKGCLHLLWQSDWKADPTPTSTRTSIWRQAQVAGASTVQTRVLLDLDLNTSWLQSLEIERKRILDGDGQLERLRLTYVSPTE
jgi:hypothetical protein